MARELRARRRAASKIVRVRCADTLHHETVRRDPRQPSSARPIAAPPPAKRAKTSSTSLASAQTFASSAADRRRSASEALCSRALARLSQSPHYSRELPRFVAGLARWTVGSTLMSLTIYQKCSPVFLELIGASARKMLLSDFR